MRTPRRPARSRRGRPGSPGARGRTRRAGPAPDGGTRPVSRRAGRAGSSARRRSAIGRGRIGLRSPRITSVGAVIREQERPAVDRDARRVARRVEPEADGPVPPRDALARQVGQQGRIRGRLGRQEPEGGHGRLDGRMPARGSLAALLHLGEPLGWNRRARVHDDQPPDPIGMPRGAGDRVVAAHRVSDEDRRFPPEAVEDADDVAREVLGRVRGRARPRALPVAALVERHDVMALRERGRDRVEPVGVSGAPVEQQDAGPGRRAPLEEVEVEAADLDPSASRGLAGEGAAHGGPCYTAGLARRGLGPGAWVRATLHRGAVPVVALTDRVISAPTMEPLSAPLRSHRPGTRA